MLLQARDHDDKKQAATAAVASVPVREPELASRALARIQQCIEKAEDQRLKVTATDAFFRIAHGCTQLRTFLRAQPFLNFSHHIWR